MDRYPGAAYVDSRYYARLEQQLEQEDEGELSDRPDDTGMSAERFDQLWNAMLERDRVAMAQAFGQLVGTRADNGAIGGGRKEGSA